MSVTAKAKITSKVTVTDALVKKRNSHTNTTKNNYLLPLTIYVNTTYYVDFNTRIRNITSKRDC